MRLVDEVEKMTRGYGSKGGKDNRAQQRARMVAFAAFAASLGASSMAQVGRKHVISYWKANRHLADSTAYSHWLSISLLWLMAGKCGSPPRPRAKTPEPGAARPYEAGRSLVGKGEVDYAGQASSQKLKAQIEEI